jgi:hypothetical protein
MQATVSHTRRRSSAAPVRSATGPSGIPGNVVAAAQLIYFALEDAGGCREVREALDKMHLLDHSKKMLDLEAFHRELVAALPLKAMLRGMQGGRGARATAGGGMNIQRCLLLGLFVILLTVASYIISVRSEMSVYQTKCANVLTLFDPKRSSVSTFFGEFNKFAQMVFNKEHIDYCNTMQNKYGSLGIYMARELNKTMSSFKARMAASFAIVTAVAGILNGGVHALVCIAARWMGELDTLCGEACAAKERAPTKAKKATKAPSPKKKEESSSSEEEEDD